VCGAPRAGAGGGAERAAIFARTAKMPGSYGDFARRSPQPERAAAPSAGSRRRAGGIIFAAPQKILAFFQICLR